MNDVFKKAHNNPPHLFRPNAVYMITASTYQKENLIHSPERKMQWRDAFLKATNLYAWRMIAWVVLNNHYHALIESPENPSSLAKLVASYHKFTARLWNDADRLPRRQVWWNYWDTCIRSEKDYTNRLGYIFWNPVKHGLTESIEDYPFSNYLEYLQEQNNCDFIGIGDIKDVPEF